MPSCGSLALVNDDGKGFVAVMLSPTLSASFWGWTFGYVVGGARGSMPKWYGDDAHRRKWVCWRQVVGARGAPKLHSAFLAYQKRISLTLL